MAALAGYEVVVVDPRRAFATVERFPGMTLRHDWPDEALDAIRLDERSAVVTLTHDPKLDDPALDRALRSRAFYIGSLGSKKTHAARLHRLSEAGFDQAALARIHGPAGLAIGAKSPAEIAVSVLAQLTAARHGQPTPMIFAELPIEECAGAVLAHALRNGELAFKKGRILSTADIAAMKQAGRRTITVAKLEADDIGEDAAAAGPGRGCCRAEGLRVEAPFTGRVNIYARERGILRVDAGAGRRHQRGG